MHLLQLIGLIFLEFNLRVHRFFRAKTTAITFSDVARRSNRLLEAIEGVRVVRLGSEPSRSNQLYKNEIRLKCVQNYEAKREKLQSEIKWETYSFNQHRGGNFL